MDRQTGLTCDCSAFSACGGQPAAANAKGDELVGLGCRFCSVLMVSREIFQTLERQRLCVRTCYRLRNDIPGLYVVRALSAVGFAEAIGAMLGIVFPGKASSHTDYQKMAGCTWPALLLYVER